MRWMKQLVFRLLPIIIDKNEGPNKPFDLNVTQTFIEHNAFQKSTTNVRQLLLHNYLLSGIKSDENNACVC